MGTSKWQALDHVVEDLSGVGNAHVNHGGQYDNFYKLVKGYYRLTSSKPESTMKETGNRLNYDVVQSNLAAQKGKKSS